MHRSGHGSARGFMDVFVARLSAFMGHAIWDGWGSCPRNVPQVMRNYLDITGDAAGVVGSAPEITGKCWDTYFWYAPGCRSQPANCLTWFTGGTGWGMFEMLVKATMYNMPLATAVAYSFADYARLPTTNDVMWEPQFFAFKSLVLYLSQQGEPEVKFFQAVQFHLSFQRFSCSCTWNPHEHIPFSVARLYWWVPDPTFLRRGNW